ncbi:TDP-N-acetylfucosamine:lipid II N-acetylfucosaminyltransferase [Achromobacter denitrificans]|uniref:TDP-N-acetylfucosamine:lipid II N-acetylfucosaminyltransferase n=1 Tax=Achromobacter denitrificans TaxID=32002 RepID=UPI00163A2BC9|nr:TDP-N-acetylfucosamine:lipid II N-acetylfucosaminyltransferase [Achromobacter denitrificans]
MSIKAKSKRTANSTLLLTAAQALTRTKRLPADPLGWKEHGRHLLNANEMDAANAALQQAATLAPCNPDVWMLLGFAALKTAKEPLAQEHFERALSLKPDIFDAHLHLSHLLLRQNDLKRCAEHIDRALTLKPRDIAALQVKAQQLKLSSRYEAAGAIFEGLIEQDPDNAYAYWNDLANIKRELIQLDEALECYLKSLALGASNPVVLSNLITLLHYLPDCDPAKILERCKEWGMIFAPRTSAVRPRPRDRSPSRILRVGMISDGFRQHPVGAMITPALEHLAQFGIELFMYTSSGIVDGVTERLKNAATHWTSIFNTSDEALADRIRGDGIDILIDLSGHNAGTRMRAIALEPAPVIVKWVGGLISTTGVAAFDYLITDRVESPADSDSFYTEKLIRMPDDYICYMPPEYAPEVQPLPAIKNGYVTFGCFNNPTKVNEVLLGHWAQLLLAVPRSRLYLKGGPFNSADLRQRTTEILGRHGIDADRIRMEGQSPHHDLLNSYSDVDIALDPWPYSGGLTTCEAMLMGVPVVTLPGPTFAGRHSATHLINSGMPELVTSTWPEYQMRAVELASDLQSLSTIRSHLRQILLQSPICDGAKFARHLADALRAIWQRYCEDKSPAALAFTPEGLPWFESEDAPSMVIHPTPTTAPSPETFQFKLQSKIVTLDHGGSFIQDERFADLSRLKALTTIVLDPASALDEAAGLLRQGSLQHYEPGIALGDGEPVVLYACLNDSFSGTLKPLAASAQLAAIGQDTTVLATLPIRATALDQIEGLGQVDWLILDDRHDVLKIIKGAAEQLTNLLIAQVRVRFSPLYAHQPDLSQISAALAPHGLHLLRLDNTHYGSYVPASAQAGQPGSQLLSAEAIFVPNVSRQSGLNSDQKLKLGFLLHACYGARDAAYHVLQSEDTSAARRYLESVAPTPSQPPVDRKRFVHICFNNMNVQGLLSVLADLSTDGEYVHRVFIEKARSVADYDVDLTGNGDAQYFDQREHLSQVVSACLAADVAGVFVHGIFFGWQKQLIKEIGRQKKITWVLWGGDFYTPIRAGNKLPDLIENIHAVAIGTDGDYQLFCQHFGHKPRLLFTYPASLDFDAIEVPTQKSKTIIVGNSGDPSNLHIEILRHLSAMQDIQDYEVILPVSYNLSSSYEAELLAELADMSAIRARLMKDFMPAADYYAMLADAEMLLTAHHRQQALGNLVASLFFGSKTVLREHINVDNETVTNPGWQLLTGKFGSRPLSFEQFTTYHRIADIPAITPDELAAQRQAIANNYGKPAVKRLLQQQFELAAKF